MKLIKLSQKVFFIFFLAAIVIIMLYPFVFSFLAGFIKKDDFTNLGTLLPLTKAPTLISYKVFFSAFGYTQFFNTLIRTVWYTCIVSLMSLLVGYVLSRVEFRGKKFFYWFIIMAQVIPNAMILIPSYLLYAKFPFFGGNNWMGAGGHGLIDNPLALYVGIGTGHIIWIYLFKNSMDTLPRDYEEAASLDGSGFFRTLFMLIVPLQKPILAVIALNTAIGTWNDFMTPFIYINNPKFDTMAGYIGKLVTQLQNYGGSNYPLIFALSTMAMLPVLIIFLFFQKYIVEGVASIGIKG